MKKRNPAKKNSAKRNVAKAVRYDDGRENDAIGRVVRGFKDEGYVNEREAERKKREAERRAREKAKNKRDEKNKNKKDDGKKDDGKKDGGKEDDDKKDKREKQKKEDERDMAIDEFKKERAARLDEIADDYGMTVDELIKKGYVEKDPLVKKAYERAKEIGNVGSRDLDKAQDTTRSLINQYKKAKEYDKTGYGDIERKAERKSDYDKVGFGDVERMAKQADYKKTGFDDLERKAERKAEYEGANFKSEDYTTKDLQKRMSPYEELVAERARKRLQKDYSEGRAQRETEAARAGAFGGSAAAVKEMADRRNYRDALKDLNAESLQKAYESAGQLTGLADESRFRAQSAEEQSRQFGSELGMKGWEAQLAARGAESSEEARQAQQQLAQTSAVSDARKAAAAEEANKVQYGLAGIDAMQKAREAGATETARAKEAELSGISGQGATAAQLAGMSDQELRQYQQKSQAMNEAGTQAMNYQLQKDQYPLDLMEKNLNVNTAAVSGSTLNTAPKPNEPSGWEKALGYGLAAAGAAGSLTNAANTIGGWFAADGGVATPDGFRHPSRMMNGGQVSQRPSLIVNLANGGVVDLHNAMFRRK